MLILVWHQRLNITDYIQLTYKQLVGVMSIILD